MILSEHKKSLSKTLSYILRHHPEDFDLEMEIDGTIKVETLIEALKEDDRFKNINYEDLENLIENDSKNRFTIIKNKNDEKKIKANYGHSIDWINIDYETIIPPEFLFHGTTQGNYKKILNQGIKKMDRNYVHLSKTIKQAVKVGQRRTKSPIILQISAKKMYDDGYNFFKTNSDIILTNHVHKRYINLLDSNP